MRGVVSNFQIPVSLRFSTSISGMFDKANSPSAWSKRREVKSCFGFRLIHTWESFARKMALELSRQDLLLDSINCIIRRVNPCHVVCNFTRKGKNQFNLTSLSQFDMKGFIVMVNCKWTSLTCNFYRGDFQVFWWREMRSLCA